MLLSTWVYSPHIVVVFSDHAYAFMCDPKRNKCIAKQAPAHYGHKACVVTFRQQQTVLIVRTDLSLSALNESIIINYRRRNLDIPNVYCMNPPPSQVGSYEHLYVINKDNESPLTELVVGGDMVRTLVDETSIQVNEEDDEDGSVLCAGDNCFNTISQGIYCGACL